MLFCGVFCDRLKYARIKPLHKNEDSCEVSNYRPVSLLTSFSKIFETVMQGRILKHLTTYNILSTEQCGFRLGLRTDNATFKLITEILNALNNKLPSRRCLHFEVVGGLEWSNDPESYAGGSVATGRASLAGKVKGDDPD